MFSGAGAESLCARENAAAGYSTGANNVGANLAPVSAKTIIARDVAFPLVDAFGPVTKARIPVPGLNVWPGRYNKLGRQYYGLAPIAEGKRLDGANAKDAAKIAQGMAKPVAFGGLGAFEPGWDDPLGLPPVYSNPGNTLPPIGPNSSSGGINWDTFFAGLFKTVPPAISAVTGRGDPLNRNNAMYYAPQTGQYAPQGYYYNSSGQLVKEAASNITDFITTNPLLVGGAVLAAILLFTRPPGRR